MSKAQALRAFVSERLAAAAEDIFVLFERTITEYEEELRRSKEETQRKQQLLDSALSPRTDLVGGRVQTPSTRPGPPLDLETTHTPQIKAEPEEHSVKQEEEQLPVFDPDSSAVCLKAEESSLLPQRQNEDMAGEDVSSEPHFHAETEEHHEQPAESDTNINDDWRAPFSLSVAQMEMEADGDLSSKPFPQNRSTSETSVRSGHVSGAEKNKHPCPFCNRRFRTKPHLQLHIRIHTGEKPFSCSVCEKSFSQKSNLDIHIRTHTGEKPYRCEICTKRFAHKGNLDVHTRTHTGEKPFSCSCCKKSFVNSSALTAHQRTHTGKKLYNCSFCDKTYVRKDHLDQHTRNHSGEKPFSCNVCATTFASTKALDAHSRVHTGKRPFSCSLCDKAFSQKWSLDYHMSSHSK